MSDDYLLLAMYDKGDRIFITDGDYAGEWGYVYKKIQSEFGHAWFQVALGSELVKVRTTHVERNQKRL